MNLASRIAVVVLAVVAAPMAAAQTRFDHSAPGYLVPEKRVQVAANVTDPKGVKLARVYFKTPAQADYVFVPMSVTRGNSYVATIPAVNASAPSLQYVLLAVNNAGEVSKTTEYTVAARKAATALGTADRDTLFTNGKEPYWSCPRIAVLNKRS